MPIRIGQARLVPSHNLRLAKVASTALRAIVPERLEGRQLFAVSVDAAGYTVVTPGRDDRVVYVSNSAGKDGNDGSSPASAVKTIGRGVDLLRDGHGDQLLLKRGDVWGGGLTGWRKGGDSADNPMVIGAYGTGDRPTVSTDGSNYGFSAAVGKTAHLVIQGVRFTAAARDPDSPSFDPAATVRDGIGIHVAAGMSDLLVEDCQVDHFGSNVVLYQAGDGPLSDVRFRKNVIVDAYTANGENAEGFFAHGVRGLLLEGNVFDHNGWNEKVAAAKPTIFNHNVYLRTDVTGVVVKGNVFANAGSHGLQARGGGDVIDNLFVANPIGLSYGMVRGNGPPTDGGVSGVVNGNVFLGNRDTAGQLRGIGIEVANVKRNGPTLISNNVFSNVAGNGVAWQSGAFAAITLGVGSGEDDATLAVGVNDLTIQGNVFYKWDKGLSMQAEMKPGAVGTTGYHNLTVKQNQFVKIQSTPVIDHPAAFNGQEEHWTGNRYDGGTSESKMLRVQGRSLSVDAWSDEHAAGDSAGDVAYADPDRSIGSFAKAAGGGDASAFLAGVRAMSSTAAAGSSGTIYTASAAIDYVRAGFDDPTIGVPRTWSPPSAPTATAELPASVTTDESSLTFAVTFQDREGLDPTSIDSGDVYLTRNGRAMAATLVSVAPSADDNRTIVATYRVASPTAVWRRKDRGAYKVAVTADGVKDTDGFSVDAGTIAAGSIDVVRLPPPPTVKKVKFAQGKKDRPDSLTITFSRDLATPPSAADLMLATVGPLDVAGLPTPATPIDLTGATVTYDPAKRRATWTFPQATNGQLLGGSYEVRLAATTIAAADDGKLLDGNSDGLGGDEFLYAKALRVKR